MFKKTILIATFCVILTGVNFLPVNAQEESITFTRAKTSGSGCRNKKQIISPDRKTVSILFENFIANNGKRVFCNLKLRADIPSGFYLQQVDVTYLGFQNIKQGGRGFFRSMNVGSKTSGGVNMRMKKGADMFIAQAPFMVKRIKRDCKRAKTHIGIRMIAFASKGSEVALDSVDLEAGKVILNFNLLPCQRERKPNS